MQRLFRIGLGAVIRSSLFIVVLAVAVIAQTPAESLPDSGPWDNIRLPENIRARKYALSLDINWETWEYTGSQEVTMEVVGDEAVNYFLIHTKDLEIDRTKTTLTNSADGSDLAIKRSFMDYEADATVKHDFYVVESEDQLNPGTYKMKIFFNGSIQTGRLTGIYRSSYIRQLPDSQPNNVTVYQIATDFEPVDARSAFPCFDEPAQKATWQNDIKVTFPAEIDVGDYSIASNMPFKNGTDLVVDGQTLSASFEESVVMSTYLVCIAITDFPSKEGVYTRSDGSTVALRILTRREADFQDAANYALEVTPKILEKYEDFYKVLYPLPKLDQIALPDFNSGAMENWGLITYRESSLLYNAETSAHTEKQRVCAVIAHEIAHQWFGNIVTMAWWNDLWLNEGFASFVEYYGIDAAEPSWNILDFFYPDEMTAAMNFDSAPSSHPISVQVSSPDELSGLFDTISYRKGSSINWMMQKFIGDEKFKDGLEEYIKAHQGANAEMVDLFRSLDTAADDSINVTEIMLTWTMQMGFPYVDVTLNSTVTPGSTTITLKQSRFLVGDKLPDDVSEYGYKWFIPFTYIDEDGTSDIIWLEPDEDETTITVDKEITWIKGNAGGNFYYIVNYEADVLAELKAKLEEDPSPITAATDRTSLFYDVFNLAKIGKQSYSTALDMTKYAVNEKEYVVLARILGSVASVGANVKDDSDAYAKCREYVKKMLKPRVNELGWDAADNEPITTPKMRDLALRNYCWATDDASDPVVSKALEKFRAFVADSEGQKSGIKDVFNTVLRTAIQFDDTDNTNWHDMWKLLQDSNWEADQRSYIAALCKTKNTDLLKQMIEDSFEESTVGDSWRYIYYVNYYGVDRNELAWELLQEHWDKYASRYNETSFTMGYLVSIPEVFDTEEKYNEVKTFFDEKDGSIGSGKKTVKETLASIQSNIKWKRENAQDVKDWFKSNDVIPLSLHYPLIVFITLANLFNIRVANIF